MTDPTNSGEAIEAGQIVASLSNAKRTRCRFCYVYSYSRHKAAGEWVKHPTQGTRICRDCGRWLELPEIKAIDEDMVRRGIDTHARYLAMRKIRTTLLNAGGWEKRLDYVSPEAYWKGVPPP